MPQFILKIELGNDAMRTNFDVGSKLMGIGNQITFGQKCEMVPEGETTIRDFHGNVVGSYQVVE